MQTNAELSQCGTYEAEAFQMNPVICNRSQEIAE
jgi:hypothetical protein